MEEITKKNIIIIDEDHKWLDFILEKLVDKYEIFPSLTLKNIIKILNDYEISAVLLDINFNNLGLENHGYSTWV